MDPIDLIRKFYSVLPAVREWMENILKENKDKAVPVINLPFPRLKKVFPLDLLGKAKVVIVAGKVPFPPLSLIGLTEFSQMENMPMAGITYKDTFFIDRLYQTESLHFHELVHVVQWERLGVDDFLLAYGVGLMLFGYEKSPLEQMAYFLQNHFDRGILPTNVFHLIQQGTDAIQRNVASLISKA